MKRLFFSEEGHLVNNINFLDCDDLNKQINLDISSISPWGSFASLSDILGIIHHVSSVHRKRKWKKHLHGLA